MSDNSLNIPDVPPEGFFGDLQEFQAWLMKNPFSKFLPRRACMCPLAFYLWNRNRSSVEVNSKFVVFKLKTYPTPFWMIKLITRVDLDCDENHNPRVYITAARVLELSKA